MTIFYIAGDIGGTNARIHLYEVPPKGDEILVAERYYKSQDYNSLSLVINQFLNDEKIEEIPETACFSVAGPVKNGAVNLTNLGWNLTENELENELNISKVIFLNDFAACGYGINLLSENELYELTNSKTPEVGGPKIIIGAGTGLGEAYIFENQGNCFVVPGEGGHTDFSPRNKEEFDLMLYIKKHLNLSRVGVERVVSGPGLELIYWFFVENSKRAENLEVSNKIRSAAHPGKVISELAINDQDVLCQKALKLFMSCYGAEAGNMALSVLPSGGVYVAGGIAPQLRDIIKDDFTDAFYNKGRMRRMLATYPIYIVMNPSIGILGARYIARRTIGESNNDITRNLSFNDVKSMSSNINLLSEQPLGYTITRQKRSGFMSGQEKEFIREEGNDRKRVVLAESNVSNALWMAGGMAFSALLLGAFVFGKRSK